MDKKIIENYLSILNINSIDQLEKHDLDYWHQKRFIEIQRKSIEKESISNQLIELNNAKEYLDKIDYEILKNQFEHTHKDNNSKKKDFPENYDEKFHNNLIKDFNKGFVNKEKINTPSKNKKIKMIGSLIGIIIFSPWIFKYYFGIDISLNYLKDLPVNLVEEFIENRKEKQIKKNKNDAYLYYRKGLNYFNSGNYTDAILEFNQAINIYPNYVLAYIERGFSKAKLGNNYAAIEDYNKAISIDSNYASAYNKRGVSKANLGNHYAAIEDYNKAIEKNPNLAVAYSNRGFEKVKLGNYYNGMNDVEKAIQINPNLAVAYNNRGYIKGLLENEYSVYSQIEDFTKAIELDPNDPVPYRNRGTLKNNILKKYKSAIKDYTKAIELNPNYAKAYNDRGVSKTNRGYNESAINDYNKAIEIDPNFDTAYFNRGNSKGFLGNKKGACSDKKKAAQLTTDDQEILNWWYRYSDTCNRILSR